MPTDAPPSPTAEAGLPGAVAATPATIERRGIHLFWWVSLAVLVLDQVSKELVRTHLPEFDSMPIIANLVDFTHVENKGVAFGLLNDAQLPFKGGVTSALAVVALVGIGLYARHIRREEWVARLGLSLILGGAVGNLIDRVRVGYVVDFVDVYWRTWHFWAFNAADASITIGAILVFLDLLLVTRHAPDSV